MAMRESMREYLEHQNTPHGSIKVHQVFQKNPLTLFWHVVGCRRRAAIKLAQQHREGVQLPSGREIDGTYLDMNYEELEAHMLEFRQEWTITLHAMMREKIGGELIRWNATRFGIVFIFLQSFWDK
uniref:Uncharacterized protein n=1 Tax=Oryza meridionalis TaxID=40149 RepID=A0A0E0E0N6_9ORYZ